MNALKSTVRFASRTLKSSALLACVAGAALASSASAASYTINWLDMSPVSFGSQVPNNSVYFLPGVGNVTVTYSIPSHFSHNRGTLPEFQNGSVVSGPDTYSWGVHEYFGATNPGNTGTTGDAWRITYSFPSTVPANQIYLGVSGLGRTTSFGGLESTATVNQSGTFLGDWISGQNYGATDFIGGIGTFTMRNSQTGAGGANPHWNSELGVVQINDALNSLTVDFWNIQGDGLSLNIGHAIPAPAALSVLGLGALVGVRRRRSI